MENGYRNDRERTLRAHTPTLKFAELLRVPHGAPTLAGESSARIGSAIECAPGRL